MEILGVILGIILGWLLGLLTKPISSRIERKYIKEDSEFAIFSELKNLAVQLIFTSFKIKQHLGVLDKQSLGWILEMYQKYGADNNKQLISSTQEILNKSDDEFEKGINHFKAAENMSLSLKTFSTPLIDSLLKNISIFGSEFQRKILGIKAQVNMLNQEIENSKNYFYLTFNPESLSANKDILHTNMKNSYNQIQEKCKYIVDLISEIINFKNKQ